MIDRRLRRSHIALGMIALALVLAACSGGGDSLERAAATMEGGEQTTTTAAGAASDEDGQFGGGGEAAVEDLDAPPAEPTRYELKVIRDGRVDIRVSVGSFETSAAELRVIAADLGGFVAQGETRLEEIDGEKYQTGWFTLRIPESQFETALGRLDGLGERLNVSLSSQDVTEEYVDLEGRLRYWKNQEEFYERLLEEATTVQDLVTIQNQMQEVLLNIESIEGRLRYLDDRTTFSSLTVGLTEVPGEAPLPVAEPEDPGIISEAISQAGTVLLGTIGFLIVGAAFLLPVSIVAIVLFLLLKAVQRTMRPKAEEG